MNNLDKYKKDLGALINLGDTMGLDLTLRHKEEKDELSKEEKEIAKKIKGRFESDYQRWYTESLVIIKQLIPDRLNEFNQLYQGEGKRKIVNSISYTIQDWLNGVRSATAEYSGEKVFADLVIVSMRFGTQLAILKSVESRFESSLFDIRQLVQADLFDSELDAARELLRHKFVRGAGAISGVVLEKHLSQVAMNHNLTVRKKNPTIIDFNELLKKGGVIDTPSWRQIQRLGDIRNLCDHNKEKEPKKEDVQDLIDGVEKFTKTLF